MSTAGCASQYGRVYDCCDFWGHPHEVKLGQDKEQIRALFGEPLTIMPLAEHRCAERWMWFSYRNAHTAYNMRTQTVDFDANGKVCEP
jgi:outer membrane protein assembly factor BamE (lipoprotein component of BamABCDE complex)